MIKEHKLLMFTAKAASIAFISAIAVVSPASDRWISSSPIKNFINLNKTEQTVLAAEVSIKEKSNIRFVRPRNSNLGMPRRRVPGASRGCSDQSEPIALTLFVPQELIGLTTAKYPTFLWKVSISKPINLNFALVEDKIGGKTLFTKKMYVDKPGIMQLEIPQDQPELLVGEQYRWSVGLICNNRPSTKLVSKAFIKRVTLSPSQESKLQSATSEYDRAILYAESGLWYNALSELTKAYIKQPNNQSILINLQSLLNQGGVSNTTAQNWQQFNIY